VNPEDGARNEAAVSKTFSQAYREMVERLRGTDEVSARALSSETW
jgi:hypothetical protein